MLIFYILQTVVPLAMIAWIALVPPRSVIGFWALVVATALGLVALSLAAILLVPPWWAPWGFGVLLVLAIVHARRRRMPTSVTPRGAMAWVAAIGVVAFSLLAADEIRLAYLGRQIPSGASVELASPLGAGHYLVVNGGTTTVVNAHADALNQSIPAHRAFFATAYGVDLVAIDRFGLRADGVMPADLRRYRIFGMPVIAPCAGTVIAAADGLPDMRVPEQDNRHLAGNHVILRCGAVDVLLAHFRQGSLRVRSGARIATGSMIGEVGNSGATSEPHLHIHAQRHGTVAEPFSGRPVPMTIEGRYLVRNARFGVFKHE